MGIIFLIFSILYICIILLGYASYSIRKRDITNIFFYLFTLVFAAWLSSHLIQAIALTEEVKRLALLTEYALAPLWIYFLAIFMAYFPANIVTGKRLLISLAWSLPAILGSALVVLGQVITEISFGQNNTISNVPGTLSSLYVIIIGIYVVLGSAMLAHTALQLRGFARTQTVSLISIILSTVTALGFINFILSETVSTYQQLIIHVIAVLFVGGMAYAINRFQIFGIRKISHPFIHSLILIFFGIIIFTIYERITSDKSTIDYLVAIQLILLSITIPFLMRIHEWTKNIVEKVFVAKELRHRHINVILEIIEQKNEIKETISGINKELKCMFNTDPTWMLANTEEEDSWNFYGNLRLIPAKKTYEHSHIIKQVVKIKETLISSESHKESLPGGKKEKMFVFMEEMNISVIQPIECPQTQRIVGYIILWSTSNHLIKEQFETLQMAIPEITNYITKQASCK